MATFKETPQPRTFAPSKEDVLQNLQYFFGAPVSPEKLKDYSEHHAMTCAPTGPRTQNATVTVDGRGLTAAPPLSCADHFPDAYAGNNTKIRDTLNNLILKSPQNWQTSVRTATHSP